MPLGATAAGSGDTLRPDIKGPRQYHERGEAGHEGGGNQVIGPHRYRKFLKQKGQDFGSNPGKGDLEQGRGKYPALTKFTEDLQ